MTEHLNIDFVIQNDEELMENEENEENEDKEQNEENEEDNLISVHQFEEMHIDNGNVDHDISRELGNMMLTLDPNKFDPSLFRSFTGCPSISEFQKLVEKLKFHGNFAKKDKQKLIFLALFKLKSGLNNDIISGLKANKKTTTCYNQINTIIKLISELYIEKYPTLEEIEKMKPQGFGLDLPGVFAICDTTYLYCDKPSTSFNNKLLYCHYKKRFK